MKDYLYGGPQGFPGTRNKPFKKELSKRSNEKAI